MYDNASIKVLMQLSAASLIVVLWSWRAYWPEVSTPAALVLVCGSFLCGAASTSVFFLMRYRHELTPGKVKE